MSYTLSLSFSLSLYFFLSLSLLTATYAVITNRTKGHGVKVPTRPGTVTGERRATLRENSKNGKRTEIKKRHNTNINLLHVIF